jgi:predicted NUDIX family NTP pyrophosphohydrolase
MAKAISAGIILHRSSPLNELMVFICHPGGPFWKNKDDGAWSIPKGLVEPEDVDLETVARREFQEEVGLAVNVELKHLGEFKQPSGKVIHVWHGSQNIDEQAVSSNMFELEWPPRSGQKQSFPEIDCGKWFTVDEARCKLLKGQTPILDALTQSLDYKSPIHTTVDSNGQVSLF